MTESAQSRSTIQRVNGLYTVTRLIKVIMLTRLKTALCLQSLKKSNVVNYTKRKELGEINISPLFENMIEGFFSTELFEKIKPKATMSFKRWKVFFRNFLISEIMKLFTWECEPIPQKEIEMRLIIFGKCGINKLKDGTLTACDISLNGITRYYDEFTCYNYTTPLESGSKKIGVDGVLACNNDMRISFYDLIDYYANEMAHIYISILCELVNMRSTSVAVCHDSKQAEGYKAFYNSLYQGIPTSVLDESFLGIDFKQNVYSGSNSQILELNELLKDVRTAFLSDIGVPNVRVKKERIITNELEFENYLPKLNIKNCFDARKKIRDDVNNLFDTNWSVKCNVEFEKEGDKNAETENTVQSND